MSGPSMQDAQAAVGAKKKPREEKKSGETSWRR